IVVVRYVEFAGIGRAGIIVIADKARFVLGDLMSRDLLHRLTTVAQTGLVVDARVGRVRLEKALEIVDLSSDLVLQISIKAAKRYGHQIRAPHDVDLAIVNLPDVAVIDPDIVSPVCERDEIPSLEVIVALGRIVPFPQPPEPQVSDNDVLTTIDVQGPVPQSGAAVREDSLVGGYANCANPRSNELRIYQRLVALVV